jgi:hypothetical protein
MTNQLLFKINTSLSVSQRGLVLVVVVGVESLLENAEVYRFVENFADTGHFGIIFD